MITQNATLALERSETISKTPKIVVLKSLGNYLQDDMLASRQPYPAVYMSDECLGKHSDVEIICRLSNTVFGSSENENA